MKTKKYLLNKFTITDAERLVNSINSLQKLLNGSREPKNIDQKFFIDIVNSNLHSDVIISHTSKSFEYALSYLRWLKNNKLDLNDYINRHKLLKDALNKSYKRKG
mgnify:FL=1